MPFKSMALGAETAPFRNSVSEAILRTAFRRAGQTIVKYDNLKKYIWRQNEKPKTGHRAWNRERFTRPRAQKRADAEQFKAILAAEIIKALDRERLTVRAAHDRTGIVAAEFSRIRNADLGRFALDRLMSILNRLGSRIEVKVRVRREKGGLKDGSGEAKSCPRGIGRDEEST